MKEDKDRKLMDVMDFLDNKTDTAKKYSKKLEEVFDQAMTNVLVVFYLCVCIFFILLLASSFMILSDDTTVRNMGSMVHVFSGLTNACHQLPYRSFIFWGVPMSVCARDVGIYLGLILGSVTVFFEKKPKVLTDARFAIVSTLPIVADGVTQTVLHLRESNNALRILTGLIFAFGFSAYVSNKFIDWRYKKFRKQVVGAVPLSIDVFLASAIILFLLSGVDHSIKYDFMGKSQAIESALAQTTVKDPKFVNAYYISSLAPMTVSADPFYENNKDPILDDIISEGFVQTRFEIIRNRSYDQYYPDDSNVTVLLGQMADTEHKFGIWAVTVFESENSNAAGVYTAGGKGEILYFDALTHKLFMRKKHT